MGRLSPISYILLFIGAVSWSCSEPATSEDITFNEHIRPILNDKCLQCHGGVKKNGDFSMLTREEALGITKSGRPAIVPGYPDSSLLVELITHPDPENRMPQESDPLSEDQISKIKAWIKSGAQWEKHWAFEPVQTSFEQSGIDQFISEKQEELDLEFSDEAAPEILIRRLSLDITGLPPTLDEARNFIEGKESYEEAVDRLLANPAYGEHWATMWLDLARYADSKGYEADRHREIWKYRDWVINALNEDVPYNEFTVLQLAGDMVDSTNESHLIATAFHRNTMNNDEGGTDNEEFRNAAVIDRVNTTWEAWMGMTFACAQCHDHPYDPFSNEEYYQFFDFLNQTADADQPSEFPTLKVYTEQQEDMMLRLKEQLELAESTEVNLLQDSLNSIKSTTVPIMRQLSDEDQRTSYIWERGNWLVRGEEVSATVPEIMQVMEEDPNRLSLARWIASNDNPLTSRVIVNRVWGEILGRGIVETQEDFGSQGAKPSHPQLLDYLAYTFVSDQEWSLKSLIKSIVMTDMYRQSSKVEDDHLRKDPYNIYLARAPRYRLSGEQIRDQALKVSGLLSKKMKGPSVMPPQPEGIWQSVYNDMKWETSEGEDRYRRSLYTYVRRTSPYPSNITFDGPSREFCVNRRITTNTPLQALVTLNDPVYLEAASSLAQKMISKGGSLEEQLSYGYELALFQKPSEIDLEVLTTLYTKMKEATPVQPVSTRESFGPMQAIANVILNLDEFLTRQ